MQKTVATELLKGINKFKLIVPCCIQASGKNKKVCYCPKLRINQSNQNKYDTLFIKLEQQDSIRILVVIQ